ncbi:hypothetical protein [Polluticoccus soli]|uniref:hypothetical protein n=1 Tax=Polluticoccus soli TaxID=3034150 RepID=UPI0023E314C2|nr:hypothetical protein [Flavipsychrobacter sp. JY13-12]
MKLKLAMLIAGLCVCVQTAQAQDDEISRTPVTSEKDINKTLFDLDTLDASYYFRANLPDNNYLTIEFKKLGYWPDKGFLKQVVSTAREVAANVADSFKRPGTSKRIDINIPISYEPLTVRTTEHITESNVVVMDKGSNMPLKIGMDTIRVLKTFAKIPHKHYPSLVQVQYTFILKDLDQINTLFNEQLVDSVETAFDNLVQKKEDKWMFPNAWYNGLDAVYDPYNPKAKKVMTTEGAGGMFNGIDADFNIGASLFRNDLAPNLGVGLNYKWLMRDRNYMFFGASMSMLGLFDRVGNKINAYDLTFINFEWGSIFTKQNTILPLYRSSIGVRYLLHDEFTHPTVGRDGWGFYGKYSLSRSTSISMDLYFLEPEETTVGVTVLFKIL